MKKAPEELRALIDNGISPIGLSSHFASKLEAYSFFVKTMQDRHRLENLNSVNSCLCCGSQPGHPTEVEWKGGFQNLRTGPFDLLLLLTGHISYRNVKIPMKTYHHICAECTRRLNTRSVILKLLDTILAGFFLATLLPAVACTVFAVGLLFYMPDTFRVFGPLALVTLFILALIVWTMGRVQLWAVPASLRGIGGPCFRLVSANEVYGSPGTSTSPPGASACGELIRTTSATS